MTPDMNVAHNKSIAIADKPQEAERLTADEVFASHSEHEVEMDDHTSWCYTFVHGKLLREHAMNVLKKRFATFVHTTDKFERVGKSVQHKEKPTISGLIFIQGEPADIKRYIDEEHLDNIYLRNDCATKRTAVIPHSTMRLLIGLDQLEGVRIIFTEHDAPFYARNKVFVRGISGIHQGLEGYIVRFHRDRMLVISLGNNLTVAVSGVNRSNFVNVEDVKEAERQGIISKK